MSHQLTKIWTTRVAQIAFIALILVVSVSVFINVFDLTPFGKRTTETILIVIPVIIALIGGAALLNVIANLNVISDAMVRTTNTAGEKSLITASFAFLIKRFLYYIGIPLIVLFGIVFASDRVTKIQKEKFLLSDAQTTAGQFQSDFNRISTTQWSAGFVNQIAQSLKLMSMQNKKFPHVTLILSDTVQEKNVYLGFNNYSNISPDKEPNKVDYVFSTDAQDREYLQMVFQQSFKEYRYTAFDGRHEFFYPIKFGARQAVLLFSEQSRYGKIGS